MKCQKIRWDKMPNNRRQEIAGVKTIQYALEGLNILMNENFIADGIRSNFTWCLISSGLRSSPLLISFHVICQHLGKQIAQVEVGPTCTEGTKGIREVFSCSDGARGLLIAPMRSVH